jgi:hypothetical protein
VLPLTRLRRLENDATGNAGRAIRDALPVIRLKRLGKQVRKARPSAYVFINTFGDLAAWSNGIVSVCGVRRRQIKSRQGIQCSFFIYFLKSIVLAIIAYFRRKNYRFSLKPML